MTSNQRVWPYHQLSRSLRVVVAPGILSAEAPSFRRFLQLFNQLFSDPREPFPVHHHHSLGLFLGRLQAIGSRLSRPHPVSKAHTHLLVRPLTAEQATARLKGGPFDTVRILPGETWMCPRAQPETALLSGFGLLRV